MTGKIANLEEFRVAEDSPGFLTMKSVNLLIKNFKRLKIIEGLRDCPRLRPDDIQKLELEISEQNFDLQIL